MDLRRSQENGYHPHGGFARFSAKAGGKGSGNGTGAWASAGVKNFVFVARAVISKQPSSCSLNRV
jgi:hypothetical protein